ncbi:hypothetical protein [Actinomadura sp. 9N407]|uniref:YxiG-like protein n=1 Tax=Actinomadura sp. 9N407 TaxID=3375154 RepID=UPI0037B35CAC
MDVAALQQALDEIFDGAVIRHGFVDYMRDYEVIVYLAAALSADSPSTEVRYLFRYCVQAHCDTSVPPDIWTRSLDDRLTDYATGVDLDGFVWGVRWHDLYPGATIVARSPTAERWSSALGIDFHEVHIQTNAHNLTLVFSELHVEPITPSPTVPG